MADYPGFATNAVALTDFVGATAARLKPTGSLSAQALTGIGQPVPELITSSNLPALGVPAGGSRQALTQSNQPRNTYPGDTRQGLGAGDPWFEKIIVLPKSLELGLLLSTRQDVLEFYNSDRRLDHELQAIVNNTGGGASVLSPPALPETIGSQSSLTLTVESTVDGPSSVDGDFDFSFDLHLVEVPLSFTTIVLWALRPEQGYDETLESLTDVIPKVSGSEQRVALRDNPRQFFDFLHRWQSGEERGFYESLLFDAQERTFGLPVWHDETEASSSIASLDTVINVASTDYADFRVGGLAVILESQDAFDVLTIDSLTSTTITFSSPVIGSYAQGASVLPLRQVIMPGALSGSRFPVNLADIRIRFMVLDNDVGSLASSAAFDSFDGKVLLTDFLSISGTNSETFERELTLIDGATGTVLQLSDWSRGKHGRPMELFTRSRQRSWEFRQLFHFLHGRQVSFYLPTHDDDLVPVLPLTTSSFVLEIANIGYTDSVQSRSPKNLIRVTFANGDAQLVRTVVSSAVVDADRETLTLDVAWPSTYAVEDVSRIEFIELVRQDSDVITISHEPGFMSKRFATSVKSLIA